MRSNIEINNMFCSRSLDTCGKLVNKYGTELITTAQYFRKEAKQGFAALRKGDDLILTVRDRKQAKKDGIPIKDGADFYVFVVDSTNPIFADLKAQCEQIDIDQLATA